MRLILLTLFSISCITVDNRDDDDDDNEFVDDNWNDGGYGGGSSSGSCQDGLQVNGTFQMGGTVLNIDETESSGLSFSTTHKVDVDLHEAGCISDIALEIEQGGLGCSLRLEFAATGNGNFELSDLSFTADSYCPNFDDELEGVYTTSGSVPMSVSGLPSQVNMRTGTEESVCLNNIDFQFLSSGSLYLQGTDVEQFFQLSIDLSGDYWSTGSTYADCEVTTSGGGSGGGGSGGGSVMNSSPGCGAAGIVCYSFVGPLWASQDTNGACSQLSSQSQAAGAGALTYIGEGCPAGASSECSGILGLVDQDDNVLDGSDYSIYFYGGADGSTNCTANGGTYTTF